MLYEADAAISLVRLYLSGDWERLRLCEKCKRRWLVATKSHYRFCGEQCRESYYAESEGFSEHRAKIRAVRQRLKKRSKLEQKREFITTEGSENHMPRATKNGRDGVFTRKGSYYISYTDAQGRRKQRKLKGAHTLTQARSLRDGELRNMNRPACSVTLRPEKRRFPKLRPDTSPTRKPASQRPPTSERGAS